MTWTYSGDPSTSLRDRLRFELGDADAADPLIQDEELDFCLSSESTFYGALAKAADAVAQRFTREATTSIGSISIENSKRAELWSQRAKEYRRRSSGLSAPSINKKASTPYFSAGMHDNR